VAQDAVVVGQVPPVVRGFAGTAAFATGVPGEAAGAFRAGSAG